MLTEEQYNFSADSAGNVAAELMWRELEAECDYEQGNIDRATYDKAVRLHKKAECVYRARISRPFLKNYECIQCSCPVNTGRK